MTYHSRITIFIQSILLSITILLSAHALADENKVTIAAYGDSLSAGYGLPPEQGFIAQLQAALDKRGVNATIINAAVSGDTTTGGLARLDWTLSQPIDGVILELGANDALRGLPPEKAYENLDKIIEKLKERNAKILLAGMRAPPNMGAQYEDRFNTLYARLAEKHGLLLYPFFLDGVAANTQLNQPDMIHPNKEGVEIIIKKITPFVEKLVTQITN